MTLSRDDSPYLNRAHVVTLPADKGADTTRAAYAIQGDRSSERAHRGRSHQSPSPLVASSAARVVIRDLVVGDPPLAEFFEQSHEEAINGSCPPF